MGRRILLVDDDPANLEFTRYLLAAMLYEVTTATGTPEAIAALQQMPLMPDLIISDVNMPAESGFNFLKFLKKQALLADIPFMFLSCTCRSDGQIKRAIDLGAKKFLNRPIDPKVLLDEIAALIGASST